MTWLFFGSGIAVSLASALMYALLPLNYAPGMRTLLIGGCVGLAVVFLLTGWLIRDVRLERAVLIAGWAAVVLITLVSVGLGEGVHAVVLGFFSVVIGAVVVLASLRAGLLMALVCSSVVGILAVAEQYHWLPAQATSTASSWVLHGVSQWLLILSAISVGAMTVQELKRHLDLVRERQLRFRTLLRMAVNWYWEVDSQYRLVAISQDQSAAGDFTDAPFRNRIPWEIPELGLTGQAMAQLRRDMEGRVAFSDVAVRRRDTASGRVLHLRMSGEPRFGANGDFLGYWGVGRDVTDQIEGQRAIGASELRYRELFDSCPTPLVLNRNGRVVDANKAAVDLMGYADRQATIGVDMLVHFEPGEPRDAWQKFVAYSEQMPVGWSSMPRDVASINLQGDRLRLQVRTVRVPTDGGLATLSLFIDETERLAAEQALKTARDQAQAASRAKSAFLANTSHEIRTPLNGLLGLAQLALQDDVDEPKRLQFVRQIQETAKSLSDIITDILDVSKIEAGKLSIERVPFDLHLMLDAIRRTYSPLATAHKLEFNVHVDAAAVPVWVMGDPVRTRQILVNFVNNAFKFTERGGVEVDVCMADSSRLRMVVSDTGPGIDSATSARLFQPFMQADESMTRRFGGTGLGLSICRELATLMGGAVGVDSRLGEGSRFWAELPLEPVAQDALVQMHQIAQADFDGTSAKVLSGSRVLVVEDNTVNRLIAVAMLKHRGIDVSEAVDGRAAVDAVDRAFEQGRPFDIVLMDVQMPVMSGFEATQELRTRYSAQALPIIALTAAALVSERDAAFACGMNEFLTKPIDAQMLWSVLIKVLAR